MIWIVYPLLPLTRGRLTCASVQTPNLATRFAGLILKTPTHSNYFLINPFSTHLRQLNVLVSVRVGGPDEIVTHALLVETCSLEREGRFPPQFSMLMNGYLAQ